MNSINLIGRLTRDPELRTTSGGTEVCAMRIAIDRQGDGADYVDVTTFGKLAEVCSQYLEKGRQIGVAGRLHYSEWETDGSKRSKHEVIAQGVQFLSSSSSSSAEPTPDEELAAAGAEQDATS